MTEKVLRIFFIGIGKTLNAVDLELFYQKQYFDFTLSNNYLIEDGKIVDQDRRKEILGNFIIRQTRWKNNEERSNTKEVFLETPDIILTEEIFIERLLSYFPSNFNHFKNLELVKRITVYKKFLEEKLFTLRESDVAVSGKRNKPDKLVDDKIVLELHRKFNHTGILWRDDIEFRDFLTCFDVANIPVVVLSYRIERRMVCVLKEIDRVNDKIALRNFAIKNYKQKKTQVKSRTPIDESIMVREIKTIFGK